MKKLLFIAIAFCGITTNVKVIAQPKIQLNKLQNPFTDRLELKTNKHTWHNPEKEFLVEVTIENNMEKGNMVKFKASGPVEKVVVDLKDETSTLSGQPITTNYSGGTTTGIFYLDTPPYSAWTFYHLWFYAPGVLEPIWYAMVLRIHPAPIQKILNKNLLKKIPNE